MSAMPFSSRFCGSSVAPSPACSVMSAFACPGVRLARKNWLIVPRLIGSGKTSPVVDGVHPVHVVGEGREAVDVLPHPLVGGVEEVRAVAVHLDAGLGSSSL